MSSPAVRPERPYFSSGPCAKFPGWSVDLLQQALVGRSHRSQEGLERIQHAIALTREVLGIPKDYLIALTPGSATGAMEMALWNMLGTRGVDILAWDVFGQLWVNDLSERLQLNDIRVFDAGYGYLPDLGAVDFTRDVLFTWNGSTSGVCLPNGDWIDDQRLGLTICDAVSAVFAYDLPWQKLDVTVFSWQKALGGEAAHGMMVLSPRAVERLERTTPSWPVPLLLRLKQNNEINYRLFEGYTINTPSMLCVEDYILALEWAQKIGGLKSLIQRSRDNFLSIERWLLDKTWIGFLAHDALARSHTGVCLSVLLESFVFSNANIQWGVIEQVAALLEKERVAYDIKNHRNACPGFRVWCGPTVERDDIEKLLPWIEWSFNKIFPQ